MTDLLEILGRRKFVGSFGVPYLDHKLKGILPNDLILIGARSGAGKSTLAQTIASHNSKNGVLTALISLENFRYDDYVVKAHGAYIKETGQYDLHIRDFMGGIGTSFKPDIKALATADAKAKEFFKGMKLTTRSKGFDLNKLKETMVRNVMEDGCKLIILDHIDYIDKVDPKENDNTHVTEIMRTIRELQDLAHVAVVAFSHLRKSQFGKAPKIPNMDEFIGSSNKAKEATVVVVFAPDDETNTESPSKYYRSTYCCVRKSRLGGYDSTCARLSFDIRTGGYETFYDTCSVNYAGTEVTNIINEGTNA